MLYLQGVGTDHVRAKTNDRFYVGSDRAFIGQAYDFSGVGRNQAGQWATMISPSYFLSSQHYYPGPGDTLYFYPGNDTNKQITFTNIMEGGLVPGTVDLHLGSLSTPIPASAGITSYPLWMMPNLKYVGLDMFVYGQTHKVGRNRIAYAGASGIPQVRFSFDTPGDGPDEASLESGDSSAPSFGFYQGKLALVGIHTSGAGVPPISPLSFNTDLFPPGCIAAIQAMMVGEKIATTQLYRPGDANLDGKVDYLDFNILMANWQKPGGWAQGDFNGDGKVDFADYTILQKAWQGTGTAPELRRE
jgi:hypothetical protein